MSTLDELVRCALPRSGCYRVLAGRAQMNIAIEVLEYFARDAEHELNTGVYTLGRLTDLFPLPSPVPLERLQQLGCGRPTDLITTHAISDTQLQAILAEAFKQ